MREDHGNPFAPSSSFKKKEKKEKKSPTIKTVKPKPEKKPDQNATSNLEAIDAILQDVAAAINPVREDSSDAVALKILRVISDIRGADFKDIMSKVGGDKRELVSKLRKMQDTGWIDFNQKRGYLITSNGKEYLKMNEDFAKLLGVGSTVPTPTDPAGGTPENRSDVRSVRAMVDKLYGRGAKILGRGSSVPTPSDPAGGTSSKRGDIAKLEVDIKKLLSSLGE